MHKSWEKELKMDEKKNIFPKSEAVDAWVHQLDGDLPIR